MNLKCFLATVWCMMCLSGTAAAETPDVAYWLSGTDGGNKITLCVSETAIIQVWASIGIAGGTAPVTGFDMFLDARDFGGVLGNEHFEVTSFKDQVISDSQAQLAGRGAIFTDGTTNLPGSLNDYQYVATDTSIADPLTTDEGVNSANYPRAAILLDEIIIHGLAETTNSDLIHFASPEPIFFAIVPDSSGNLQGPTGFPATSLGTGGLPNFLFINVIGGCSDDADCDDGDSCTVDTCVSCVCVHTADPDDPCCVDPCFCDPCSCCGCDEVCENDVCVPLPGQQCCFPDGSCSDVAAPCCTEFGGSPLAGMCFPAGGLPPEACCLEDGTCIDTDPTCCTLANGMPQGPGTDCQPTGACCLDELTCIITSEECCAGLEGIFLGANTTCPTQTIVVPIHTATQWTHVIETVVDCPNPGRSAAGCADEAFEIDPWTTELSSPSCEDFGNPEACPIPADFFGPGSDPFTGSVCLEGVPLGPTPFGEFGDADTLVRRTQSPFDRCDVAGSFPSAPVTVDIEVVALSLMSINPITVTFNGGQNPEQWDVEVTLSDVASPPSFGTLTATKTHCNGGTYDSDLNVTPKFIFTRQSDMLQVELDVGAVSGCNTVNMMTTDDTWVHDTHPNLGVMNPVCTDFFPGIDENNPLTNPSDCDCNVNMIRDECELSGNDCNLNGIPDDCDVNLADPDGNGEVSLDCNTNGIPDECELADNDCDVDGIPDECGPCGDLDGDADVDDVDFALFLNAFGHSVGEPEYDPSADYDNDGKVTFVDYQIWLCCYRSFITSPLATPPRGTLGDFDADGDLDLLDFRRMQQCVAGLPQNDFACVMKFDFDGDGAIDLDDFGAFAEAFNSP